MLRKCYKFMKFSLQIQKLATRVLSEDYETGNPRIAAAISEEMPIAAGYRWRAEISSALESSLWVIPNNVSATAPTSPPMIAPGIAPIRNMTPPPAPPVIRPQVTPINGRAASITGHRVSLISLMILPTNRPEKRPTTEETKMTTIETTRMAVNSRGIAVEAAFTKKASTGKMPSRSPRNE